MSTQDVDPTITGYPGVKKGGAALTDEQSSSLAEVIVDLDATRPGMFVLRFVQSLGPDASTNIDFSVGDEVEVSEQGSSKTLIKGEVTSVEAEFGNGGQRTMVRGYDKSHRLHRARNYKAYLNVKDSDVASQLIGQAGLVSGTIDSTTSVHKYLVQVNQTDWEFLKWRAEENGLTLDSSDGQVNFRKPDPGGPAAFTLSVQETMLAFRPRITAPQVTSVKVQAWDESTKTAFSQTATVSASTAAQLTDSPDGLANKFNSVEHLSTTRTAETASDPTAIAQALADRFADSFVDAEGVAYGNPGLVPGVLITVQDAGTKFNGDYRITAAKHIFNAEHRYSTSMRFTGVRDSSLLSLTSNSNGNGGLVAGNRTSRIEGVVSAIVTNVKDPENRCRVKLKFPWLDDNVESEWCRIVQSGAGPSHGWVTVPEVNDEVLVAFEQGDFRRPYVLGGLYNGTDKPDKIPYDPSSGSSNLRGFSSLTNHRLVFQDDGPDKKGIHLITGDDNFEIYLNQDDTKITIDAKNGKVEIHGSQDVTIKSDQNIAIEATQKLSLKGQTGIDINSPQDVSVSGLNAKISANAKASMSGNAGLDLTTSAVAKLQGSLVQIN